MLDKGKNVFDQSLIDEGWSAMHKILEKELPQEKKRRRFLWWWFSGIGVAAVGLSLLWGAGSLNLQDEQLLPVDDGKAIVVKTIKAPNELKNVTESLMEQASEEKIIINTDHSPKIHPEKLMVNTIPAFENLSQKVVSQMEHKQIMVEDVVVEDLPISNSESGAALEELATLEMGELQSNGVQSESLQTKLAVDQPRKYHVYLALDAMAGNAELLLTGAALEAGIIFNKKKKMNISVGLAYGRNTIRMKSNPAGVVGQTIGASEVLDTPEIVYGTLNPNFIPSNSVNFMSVDELNYTESSSGSTFYSEMSFVSLLVRANFQMSPRFFIQGGIHLSYRQKIVNFSHTGNYSLLESISQRNEDHAFASGVGNSFPNYSFSSATDNRVIHYSASPIAPVAVNNWAYGVNMGVGVKLSPHWSTRIQVSSDLSPGSSNESLIKRVNSLTLSLGLKRTF